MTNRFSRTINNFLPMVSPSVIGHIASKIDNPDVIIAAESIVVHNDYLQHQVLQVETWDKELE